MKIICIGRNYVAHAEELNNEVPKEPLVFMKPESALNSSGMIDIPEFTSDLHYELELVLRISREAKNVSKEEASQYYDAVALGIDFTKLLQYSLARWPIFKFIFPQKLLDFNIF